MASSPNKRWRRGTDTVRTGGDGIEEEKNAKEWRKLKEGVIALEEKGGWIEEGDDLKQIEDNVAGVVMGMMEDNELGTGANREEELMEGEVMDEMMKADNGAR